MAEQNVLTGNINVLEQIMGDVNEYHQNKQRFDKISENIRDLKKATDAAERSVQAEIEERIKQSTASICQGYDQSIDREKDKLKDVQNARDKAKIAGVKERIANETADLVKENKDLKEQVKEAFKQERIPNYCNSKFYLAMFRTKGVGEYLIFLASILLLYVLVPGVTYLLPEFPRWGLIIYYCVVIFIELTVYKWIYNKTLVDHAKTIDAARSVKMDIVSNKKRMKRIEKRIRTDKNEDMYGLHSFDTKINELNDNIRNIEQEKANALDEFERTAKSDIIAEIEGRNASRINAMKSELDKKQDEFTKLENLTKEQLIYITSNYETYLGKDVMTPEKLMQLHEIMMSSAEITISQALVTYRDKR
jgi:hypothetical protein